MERHFNEGSEPNNNDHSDNFNAAPDSGANIRVPLEAISPALLAKRISVAFGERREAMIWTNWPQTVEGLLKRLSKFRRGDKNGSSLTQGPVIGGRRQWKSMARNYLLMVDCDTGESLDEIEAKIRENDLAALLWTTYSHNKPFTHVPENKLLSWARKNKVEVDSNDLVALMKRYLQTTDKVKQSIIDSITRVERESAPGVVRYVVHHDPMPRVRALFILNEPFDFLQGGSQENRAAEWKEKYAGFCKTLGLAYDRSCVDPSRLMYRPVIAPGADASQHEIRWVEGRELDLSTVRRASELEDDDPFATFTKARASTHQTSFTTPGLSAFLKRFGTEFDAASFLRDIALDDIRSDTDGKVECMCPNDDAHSNAGDPNDRAFFATDSIDGGWTMHCQHDSCITAASEHSRSGKPDRAWFLDIACQKYGIEHADQLKQWTTSGLEKEAEEAERERKRSETLEALSAAVSALNADSDTPAIRACIDLLVALAPTPLELDDWLARIAKRTGRKKSHVNAEMKSAQSRRRDEQRDRENPEQTIPASLRAAFEDLNEAYAVTNVSGKACVTYINDVSRVEFMSKCDFELMLANKPVWSDRGERIRVASRWFEWSDRNTFDGVEFDPGSPGDFDVPGTGKRVRNLFRGFPITAASGDWSLFRKHLFEVICRRDPFHFTWLWNWYADIFRNPAVKPGTAIVMRGAKGTGKSKVFELISQLCPNNSLVITKKEQAFGKFNAHLAECLFANIEEAFWAGEKGDEGTLKEEITGLRRPVEPKGQNMFMVKNCTRYQFISNEDWVVPATADERRYFVLDVSSERARNYSYFGDMDEQMKEGGLNAMMFDFLNISPPSWINLREAPRTKGLLEQIERSLSVEHRWLRHVLETGQISSTKAPVAEWPSDTPSPLAGNGCRIKVDDLTEGSIAVRKDDVYASFQEWCASNYRGKHVPSAETIGRFLAKEGINTVRPGSGDRKRCYVFPPLAEMRTAFAARHGVIFDDTNETTRTGAAQVPAEELEAWRAYGAGEKPMP